MNVAVLGGGSWGTALANVLARKGEDACLWTRREDAARKSSSPAPTPAIFRGSPCAGITRGASADLAAVLKGARCVVLAVPCQNLGPFLRENRALFPVGAGFVCASKGVELGTFPHHGPGGRGRACRP